MNSLEYLKKEIKNLENMINELENKGNNKYKRKRYDRYWFLNDIGATINIKAIINNNDNFKYSIGNYFETKEQAKNYKEKLLIEQKLRDIAMELNKGKEIDWDNDIQDKYYLYYNFLNNEINYNSFTITKLQGIIYCLNENFKDVAKNRIGEERLTKYLKGELD